MCSWGADKRAQFDLAFKKLRESNQVVCVVNDNIFCGGWFYLISRPMEQADVLLKERVKK